MLVTAKVQEVEEDEFIVLGEDELLVQLITINSHAKAIKMSRSWILCENFSMKISWDNGKKRSSII